MPLDATYANMIINARLGTSSFVPPVTPVLCRLMVVNGNATALGTELPTGGGYVAGTGAPVVTFASAASQSAGNNTAVIVTNMPACTIVGVELWDSSGSPRRMEYCPLTASKTCNAGDTFELTVGELTSAQT
jgi:hypothetical protein